MLNDLITLTYTYTIKTSYETAQELNNIRISMHNIILP
jgi:hypothetical protein